MSSGYSYYGFLYWPSLPLDMATHCLTKGVPVLKDVAHAAVGGRAKESNVRSGLGKVLIQHRGPFSNLKNLTIGFWSNLWAGLRPQPHVYPTIEC